MKEQFVTYEIALKIKELGFDEPCFGYYEVSDKLNCGVRLRFIEHEDNNPSKQPSNKDCLAPLWQQVIDWVREKYDLSIEIQRNIHIDTWKYNIITIHQPGVYLIQTVNESKHNSIQFSVVREQAILKAIKTCQK